ncbi:helix-turn-helix domain-containing protein [Streptomyces hydrogenans]|uniref:helix-turn-helix domain-containing protein n=1 Tax=Streptomyces hydrogenans TaxID=1873719 RepID=UPI0035E0D701
MIPQGRPAVNESDIAQLAGVSLSTWRRHHGDDFRVHVPDLLPDSRNRLYDRAQAEAYLAGEPVPALPEGEHLDDLLSAGEVAEVLGISAGTVRAYTTSGHFSPGVTVHGSRLWSRREVLERRDNAPGRGAGGGRRAGEPQGPRKAHAYEGDPRLDIARKALAAAGGAPKGRVAAELAALHGSTPRTWERLLTTAALRDDADGRFGEEREAQA